MLRTFQMPLVYNKTPDSLVPAHYGGIFLEVTTGPNLK